MLREEEEYYARSHDEATSKVRVQSQFGLSNMYKTKNNPCMYIKCILLKEPRGVDIILLNRTLSTRQI